MKSVNWRLKHIADGDTALAAAAEALQQDIVMHSNIVDARIARAQALIALGRAHYRACEIDAALRFTP